jgi:hypothetical protein
MALYRFICALGHHSLVTVLVKCRLALPVYIVADEKHSHCLTDRVYLPTIVSGRVIWHLGYSESKRAAAFTESYGAFQRMASHTDPSYQVKGALTEGFDSTANRASIIASATEPSLRSPNMGNSIPRGLATKELPHHPSAIHFSHGMSFSRR